MAIKGFSQEVVDALEFNPFDAGTGGDDAGQQDQQNERSSERRTQNRAQEEDRRNPSEKRFDHSERDASTGRFQPQQKGRDASPDGGAGKKGEQKPSGAVPQKPGPKPDETQDDGTNKNPIQELMDSLQKTPGAALLFGQQPGGQPQGQPQQQPHQQQDQQQQQRPAYDYSKPYTARDINLPPQLLQAIFNEDPNVAGQGLQVLVSTMYNNLQAEMHNRVAQVIQTLPQQIMQQTLQQTELQSGQKALRDKFYSSFPDLKTPMGMQAVYSLAQNVARMYEQMGQQVDPLSDDFVQYVGNQARLMLGMQGQGQQQQEKRRQFQTGGGARNGLSSDGDPFMDAIGM